MRPLRDIVDELASYAPEGGDTWQNVGVRAVPVRLLTELKQRLDHDAWEGFDEWFADVRGHGQHSIDAIKHMEIHAGPIDEGWSPGFEYAGAWKFEP